MTATEQASTYLQKCPGAVSGSNGHSTAYSVVCAVVNGFALDEREALDVLTPWNRTCQPPWSDRDLLHKIRDAISHPHDVPLGSKLRKNGVRYRYGSSQQAQRVAAVQSTTPRAPAAPAGPAAAKYAVPDSTEIPDPLPDGARTLLTAAFQPGEAIRIAQAVTNEDGREQPKDAGITLTREEWIKKLDGAGGDINRILKTSDKNGIFCCLNPFKAGGSRDSDVTAFRHALLEFDNISQHEQWGIIQASGIPCTAVISSGGKSIHAWVRVDAADRREFDDRVKALYDHFAEYKPDIKNKNPSRFSRLAGCERGARRQELLAVGIGAESFSQWLAEKETDGIGTLTTIDDLRTFDPAADPTVLLGNRWICRGGSCLLIGPSGVGKSSLMMQLCVHWAIGQACFGIAAHGPLKIMVIQAENDLGDLAEMMQGVTNGSGIMYGSDEWNLLKSNLIFIRDNTHTSEAFVHAVRRLIDRHKPNLVVFDPLLSFIGADISKQEVCGQFLRNWLGPIAEATGVAWLCVHHTGKPSTDPKSKKHWHSSDFSYSGLGSSELTNWTRATMVLEQTQDGFKLLLPKRGKRAAARHPDGQPTTVLHLRHSPTGIHWDQVDPPQETAPAEPEEKPKKLSAADKVAAMNSHDFIAACKPDGEGLNQIANRLLEWIESKRLPYSLATCKQSILPKLLETGKLIKKDGKFYVGDNA